MQGLFAGAEELPGVLGDPPRHSASQGMLASIFAGADDPRLSAEQNAAARKQSLIRAGIATILAGSNRNGNILSALATGALAGSGARQQISQGTVQSNMQQELAQLAQSGALTPDVMKQLFQRAVATGNAGLATAIVGMMNATQPDEAPDIYSSIGDRGVLNKRTGEVTALEPLPKAPAYGTEEWYKAKERELQLEQKYRPTVKAPARGQPRSYVDEATGEQKLGVWNPETGEFDPVKGAAPIVGASDAERKTAAFLQMIPRHIAFVDSFEGAPGRIEQALSDKGLREFTGEDQQKLRLAAIMIGEAWLRPTTGAAYNDNEFANAGYAFLPAPGDKKGTLEMKREMRKDLMNMLRTNAGRAAPVKTPDAGTDPFASLPGNRAAAPGGWQARASELRAAGKSEADIIAALRKEGMIK
jgi:hypothetical protein